MKQKRMVALLAVAALTVGMLGGCGGSDKKTDGSDTGKKEKLTLWMPPFASTDGEVTDEEFWSEKLEKFGEENNCEVRVEIIPWDNYEEKYLTGATSNEGPDVGYMYMEMFYDYIDMGALVNVDQYFTEEEKDNYKKKT